MQHKNAKIQFLEQTLSAHEQVSGHMKEELDQLQSGMETVSVTRRAEVEEIQEDLMDAQAKTTKYERKITSLKMELEEIRLQHRKEVGRLEDTIMSLESDSESPMMRDVAMERERRVENDYRQQLKDLMTKVNTLQEENATLKHTSDKNAKVRASNNDKWRNSALQEQVIRLQQRLREYEGDSESVRSGSSRRSSRTESSRRIPRTPAQSYRKDSSSRSGGRDDISTHTEMTF
jgi:chromosome segregation ATPase